MRDYWQDLPRRIRDTFTGEVWWYSFKDRHYHDQAGRRSFLPSYFYGNDGELQAYYEVAV